MSIDGSDLFYLFTSNEAARKIIRQKKSTFTRTYLNALQTYKKEIRSTYSHAKRKAIRCNDYKKLIKS